MESYFTHKFEAVISEFGVGKTRKIWYRVVFMPTGLERLLAFDEFPRLRIDGEISDIPIANAFMPTGDGRRYLIVSPEVMKGAELSLGDTVTVRFRIADQNHVDVPDALLRAVGSSNSAKRVWDTLTPGKKRALAFHVSNARTAPTQAKRVTEVLHALENSNGKLRR
ncbi:MAG: YdeI/OmpD-associated family protein [Pseudomonadota bacterium]